MFPAIPWVRGKIERENEEKTKKGSSLVEWFVETLKSEMTNLKDTYQIKEIIKLDYYMIFQKKLKNKQWAFIFIFSHDFHVVSV